MPEKLMKHILQKEPALALLINQVFILKLTVYFIFSKNMEGINCIYG